MPTSNHFITDQASDVIVKRHVFHDNMDFIKSHNELHDRNEREFRVTRNKFAHMFTRPRFETRSPRPQQSSFNTTSVLANYATEAGISINSNVKEDTVLNESNSYREWSIPCLFSLWRSYKDKLMVSSDDNMRPLPLGTTGYSEIYIFLWIKNFIERVLLTRTPSTRKYVTAELTSHHGLWTTHLMDRKSVDGASHCKYSSPMASLVLTDSSQLTTGGFEKLPDQIIYPYAEPYDQQKHSVSEMCSRYTGLIVDEDTDPTYDEDMSILGSSETGTFSSSGTIDTAVSGTSDGAVSVDPSIPKSFDWREKGYETPVEVLEAQWLKVKNRSVGLSEQYLIDCSEQKCSGGTFKNVFEFIKQNWTVARSAYPYTALGTESCHEISRKIATLKSYKRIPAKNETAMMNAIANHGPIVCGVCASSQGFMLYHTGIFSLRHDVLALPRYLQLKAVCFLGPQVHSARDRMFSLSPGIFSLRHDILAGPRYIQLETGCFPCPQVYSARDRMFSLSPDIFSLRHDVLALPRYLQLKAVYSARDRMFSLSPGIFSSRQDVFLVSRYLQLETGIFSLKYDGENCTTINHAITLWGYVNDNNSSYFILKNSWGPAWGESGYMRLKMGENNCGVGDLCYYITVE
uniref:Peptidase C1A papain C-terminal domain-containing protein n=1 Tax=Timema poppense TaxID=170557 RepID=A0A7R9CSX7_TIMPO|nr:unnamed protein product [Timema poppensis]